MIHEIVSPSTIPMIQHTKCVMYSFTRRLRESDAGESDSGDREDIDGK